MTKEDHLDAVEHAAIQLRQVAYMLRREQIAKLSAPLPNLPPAGQLELTNKKA